MSASLVTLTTDFGTASPYVAQMKGVLYGVSHELRVVDVSHDIKPQNLLEAAWTTRAVAPSFPTGTVHVVVVDPGVGSSRRPIAVRAAGQYFVGPDNGVLGWAASLRGASVVELDRRWVLREPVSTTFHGRDIFAPVGAELALGFDFDQVGSPIDDAIPCLIPEASALVDKIRGEVVYIDRFGNCISNIPATNIPNAKGIQVDQKAATLVPTYSAGDVDSLLAVCGSDGWLEFAVREGSAAERFDLKPGVPVEVLR